MNDLNGQNFDQLRPYTEAYTFAPDQLRSSVKAVKDGATAPRLELCAALLHAGFRNPFAIPAAYNSLADGWLGGRGSYPESATDAAPDTGDYTEEFWLAFTKLLTATANPGALELTASVAALGGTLHPQFGELAEAFAAAHPGAANAQNTSPPPMIDLQTLAAAPADSLAGELHQMLVANGYDAEVLDRQALGLGNLPPALSYLNTRILQMHDVWHLAAGYRTTSLHEIAISSFQLAQFGHNYSAMFLAVVTTIGCFHRPEGLPILLQIIAEAWRHGSTTPSLMAINWEQEWHKPIATVRDEQNIEPFTSTLPANLFETLAGAPTPQ